MDDFDARRIQIELSRIGDWLEAIAGILADAKTGGDEPKDSEDRSELVEATDPPNMPNIPAIEGLVEALQHELRPRRGGGEGPDPLFDREEEAKKRKKERIEQEMAETRLRLETEARKLRNSMGSTAFKEMVRQNGVKAGVAQSKLNTLASAITATEVVIAAIAVMLVIDTIRGMQEVLAQRREQDKAKKEKLRLEKAYVDGIFTNAHELERMERAYNAV